MKKIPSTNLLGAIVRDYFADHLPRLRGSSPHTIHSYRDSTVLLLRFIAEQRKVPLANLDLVDLDPPRISRVSFLPGESTEQWCGYPQRAAGGHSCALPFCGVA